MMLQGNLSPNSRAVGPSLLARCCAVWTGRRDGRAGLPSVALDLDAEGRLQPPTPTFRERVDHLVREGRDRRYASFMRRHGPLRRDIHGKAQRVLEQADANPVGETIEQQRFTAALAHWTSLVQAERPRIDALTHRGNVLLTSYWSAVQRHHPIFRDATYAARVAEQIAQRNQYRYPQAALGQFPSPGPGWKPLPLARDQSWDNPLDLLILPDASASSIGPLRRALQVITDPRAAHPNRPRPAEAS